ncbi:MAG: lysylphosphatidylglycerol synthase transmembrane domain-containing protein [Candidatus Dormibacteria bacterium]
MAAEGESTHAARTVLRRVLTTCVGLGGIAAVVVFLDPARVGSSLRRFDVPLVAPILGLSLIAYMLQGLRWHYLLREVGVRLRLRDTVLVNLAGQTITAIVPLGDLTRAAFAAAAAETEFGVVVATVTVQELSYTLLLTLSALPEIMVLGYGLAAVIPTAIGIALIVAVLTVSPLFCVIHGVIGRIPLLNRLLPAIDELQEETVVLLHRPETLLLSVLDAARVVVSVSVFWCICAALAPGHVGWWQAAFVLALSTIGGAISLVPGGVGANEASVAALLIFLGVDGGSAGAVAIIQRTLITGLSLSLGFLSYTAIHRRLHLGGLFSVFGRRPPAQPVDVPGGPLVHSGLT